jgi:hypothetical protein
VRPGTRSFLVPGRAGDHQHLAFTALDHRGEHCFHELIRGVDQAAFELVEIGSGRLEEAADDDLAGEGGGGVDATELIEAGLHEPIGDIGIGQVPHALGDCDRGAEALEFVDQARLWVADDQVVAPLRQLAGQWRANVEARVRDECDTAVGAA